MCETHQRLSSDDGKSYVDDHAPHVAGAQAVGFDAVQYVSTPQLAVDLRGRGIQFNY